MCHIAQLVNHNRKLLIINNINNIVNKCLINYHLLSIK